LTRPSVFDFTDYKKYIGELADVEPRGFKKKLAELANCQTAYVSHVLNGHAHFSWEQAEAISTGIGHTHAEKEFFLLIVKYSTAGTPSLRKFVKSRLDTIRDSYLSIKERVRVKDTLSREDQAKYYSAWYIAAVHVMLTIPKFQTREALATHLKLSPMIVADTLDFLISVGLAVRNGSKYAAGLASIHLEKESPLISKHHTNWRMAAVRALENGTSDNLHYSSVFTISETDFQKIRGDLVKAIEKNVATIKDSPEETTVAMTLDLFRI